MTGPLDLSDWGGPSDRCYDCYECDYKDQRIAELEAQVGRMSANIKVSTLIIENTEEINPSNYNHDLVCQMNSVMNEVYSVLTDKNTRNDGTTGKTTSEKDGK